MRFLRVAIVSIFAFTVLTSGASSAAAEETCALLVLCPAPEPPPAPAPAPAPAPEPQPQPQPEPAPAAGPRPAPAGDEPASAQELVHLLDRSRAEHGLAPLRIEPAAEAIAFEHSREMAARGDIWHNDELFTAATKKRLGARTVGENVALNTAAVGAHERLMASEAHRANILNGAFTAGAVGAVRGEDGRLYVTQVFIETLAPAPAQQAPTVPRAPTAATVPSKKPARSGGATAGAAPTSAPAPPRAAPHTAVGEHVEVDAGAGGEPVAPVSAADGEMSEFASGRELPRPATSEGDPLHGPGVLAALALVAVCASTTAAIRRRRRAA